MLEVSIQEDVVNSILTYSKDMHPREAILLLKGRMDARTITVAEIVIPPQAAHGIGFSAFPLSPLPLDMGILGVVHSHPSGSPSPSVADLNDFYGGLMIICAYPYSSTDCIRVYDAKGREIPFRVGG
jgi:proteasome lid subunit RPN8/RPN11